jgi:hypothetical protein
VRFIDERESYGSNVFPQSFGIPVLNSLEIDGSVVGKLVGKVAVGSTHVLLWRFTDWCPRQAISRFADL